MKKVVITIGDPAGCGPVITLEAINALKKERIDFFVVGDKKILEKIPVYRRLKKRINLMDLGAPGAEKIKKGVCSKQAGSLSLDYLDKGLEVLEELGIRRLVTAPLSKEAVKLIRPGFSGHTEYLAGYFGGTNVAMMMVSQKVKTVLFTRHIPLGEVSSYIKKGSLRETITLVYSSLRRAFKIKAPRLAVASFNPHAGVDTFLGREEKTVRAAIKEFPYKVYGPYPADTIFVEDNLKKYDCVICLYHDQAMIPFKLLSFRDGVNLTLGLPVIRTSPAHGVAYELMRQGRCPFFSSMVAAIKLAVKLSV
jgi:4-hydroxythreonine-4-phosphate dehydrogenase